MMELTISTAVPGDLNAIYQLFEEAILFQKSHNYVGWLSYDKDYIKSDIHAGLLYKLMKADEIVCIFSICFSDALIWRQKEKGNALYLHRVVLNQKFKGEKTFKKILAWVVERARRKQLQFIRMDTWAQNQKIIAYYEGYGFTFIENYTTPDTENLPLQHRNLNVALLELPINNEPVANVVPPGLESAGSNMEKINLIAEIATIDKYWSQKIIGKANGQLIKLAKGIGEINWHKHDDQDEMFLLLEGQLTIQLRAENIDLLPNDLFIVPRGIEHCPYAHGEAAFLIMGLNVTSNAAGGRPATFSG